MNCEVRVTASEPVVLGYKSVPCRKVVAEVLKGIEMATFFKCVFPTGMFGDTFSKSSLDSVAKISSKALQVRGLKDCIVDFIKGDAKKRPKAYKEDGYYTCAKKVHGVLTKFGTILQSLALVMGLGVILGGTLAPLLTTIVVALGTTIIVLTIMKGLLHIYQKYRSSQDGYTEAVVRRKIKDLKESYGAERTKEKNEAIKALIDLKAGAGDANVAYRTFCEQPNNKRLMNILENDKTRALFGKSKDSWTCAAEVTLVPDLHFDIRPIKSAVKNAKRSKMLLELFNIAIVGVESMLLPSLGIHLVLCQIIVLESLKYILKVYGGVLKLKRLDARLKLEPKPLSAMDSVEEVVQPATSNNAKDSVDEVVPLSTSNNAKDSVDEAVQPSTSSVSAVEK